MTAFSHLDTLVPHVIWPGVIGRSVVSENATFSYLELDPETHVPEHAHPNEQVGALLRGSLRFRIGEDTADLTPGATWCILADVPHEVWAGPDGAALVELFAPRRDDWGDREQLAPGPPARFA